MQVRWLANSMLIVTAALASVACAAPDNDKDKDDRHEREKFWRAAVQIGERPYYLLDGMDNSKLKSRLEQCKNGPFYKTDFSIAHRGAPLQFPEHTKESYEAAARMGAGIVECDVTFTKDGELVCRHDECDLHTTTNIVATDLNNKCSVPWTGPGSSPRCCASDLTLDEFKSLTGKMDASAPSASTPQGYLGGTATWRTDLYTGRGTLLTLRESIELNRRLGVKHTPELKAGNPERLMTVFGGQENYAQKMIDEFKKAKVDPRDVFPQSFDVRDVLYWVRNEPHFGKQAVYLDDINAANPAATRLTNEELKQLKAQGVKIIAPPMGVLLSVDGTGELVPSQYALDIKSFGFEIITWSFERVDLRRGAKGVGSYYAFDPTGIAIKNDADMYKALDALAKKVRVKGVFSDWPATVTYYANCMGL